MWLLPLCIAASAQAAESQCHGTPGRGRIDGSVKLPAAGPNFSAYSDLGVAAGRTHVHTTVSRIMTRSYAMLARTQASVRYVYGETGWAAGGRLRPHRTHQNGLSVDFFVPVRNAAGESVPLPAGPFNRLGYDVEFDVRGRWREYRIDFPALADHLHAVHQAAVAEGAGIALVIIDPVYLRPLLDTPHGPYLRQHLPFMKGRPWIRHDEHYHIDFRVSCKPLAGTG